MPIEKRWDALLRQQTFNKLAPIDRPACTSSGGGRRTTPALPDRRGSQLLAGKGKAA